MAVEQLDRTFAALADPTRREILDRLAEGEATVNELAEPFPITVQAVSKHLKVLERAGLITRARSARLRPSRLNGAPLGKAVEWLERYRPFWEMSFEQLETRLRTITAMAEPELAITISRVFDAPREEVWREWTEPKRFADWFGGPDADVPLPSVSMDVRDGGSWRLTMFARRGEIRWEGKYLEVVAPERLVFTITDQPDAGAHVCTVVLADLGDGRTEMSFEQRGRMSPEQHEAAGKGWSGFFDRIAERLAA